MGGGPPGPTSQSALPPCVSIRCREGLAIIAAIIDNAQVGHQSSAQPRTHSTRSRFFPVEARKKSAPIVPAAAVDDTARQTSGFAAQRSPQSSTDTRST